MEGVRKIEARECLVKTVHHRTSWRQWRRSETDTDKLNVRYFWFLRPPSCWGGPHVTPSRPLGHKPRGHFARRGSPRGGALAGQRKGPRPRPLEMRNQDRGPVVMLSVRLAVTVAATFAVTPAICFTPTLAAVPLLPPVDVRVIVCHLMPLSAVPLWAPACALPLRMLACACALRLGARLADAMPVTVPPAVGGVGVAASTLPPRTRGPGRPPVRAALVAVLCVRPPAEVVEAIVARNVVRMA